MALVKRILPVLLLLLAGCATTSWQAAGIEWTRASTTEKEFLRDRQECQASGDVAHCLSQRGYTEWSARTPIDRARETVPRR